MIRTIILTFIVISILIIGFNVGSFFSKPEVTKEEEKKSSITPIEKDEERIETDKIEKKVSVLDNTLYSEIDTLLNEAEKLLQNSKDTEALLVYDTILKKIGTSSDPKLLEHFANVWILKAFIYQIYPNNDKEAALEAYDMVIEKFEKSSEPKFLKYYMNAKLQQARLLTHEEKLEVYDELIKKFKDFNDPSIQEDVESLLISKSFDLMGQNDEEAMQILDDVIEKYQDKNENAVLPENIRFSILNNIELAIITDNDNEKYIELAEKFMSKSPDTKPLIEMLSIIKDSQDLNQDEALAQWKDDYSEYRFPDWSFQELERWAYKIEDPETKERVTQYINAFVNQKYNIPEEGSRQHPTSTSIKEEHQTETTSYENMYGDPYTPKPEEELIEEEDENPDEPIIEESPDPYQEELSEEPQEEEQDEDKSLEEIIPPLSNEMDKEREEDTPYE